MGWAARLGVGPGKAGYTHSKPRTARGVMTLGALGAHIEGELGMRAPRGRLSKAARLLRTARRKLQKASRRGNR